MKTDLIDIDSESYLFNSRIVYFSTLIVWMSMIIDINHGVISSLHIVLRLLYTPVGYLGLQLWKRKHALRSQHPYLPVWIVCIYCTFYIIYFSTLTGYQNSVYIYGILCVHLVAALASTAHLQFVLFSSLSILIYVTVNLTLMPKLEQSSFYVLAEATPAFFLVLIVHVVVLSLRRKRIELEQRLTKTLTNQTELINAQANQLALTKTESSLAEQARRVAHDIKSPLSALNVALDISSNIDQDVRKLMTSAISRIHNIADLLSKERQSLTTNPSERLLYLPSAIDELLAEKQTEYILKAHLTISRRFSPSASFAFANIPEFEFKSTISNLVNNAIEAICDFGAVTLELSMNDSILLSVNDTGKGIPPEHLDVVTKKGFSTGKNGDGLGLYLAKNALTSWGGDLQIISELDKGTAIKMTIPTTSPPKWLARDIRISRSDTIVVLDDDASIFKIWQEKLGTKGTKIEFFATSGKFLKWYQSTGSRKEIKCFLDYSLDNHNLNGVQLAIKYDLTKNSYVVSGHYEDESLHSECEAASIPIIPKAYLSLFPIHIEVD